MRCDRNQSTSARMSRLNPPNSRVSLDTAPPSPLINTVTTCFILCTSIPATRSWIGSIMPLPRLCSTCERLRVVRPETPCAAFATQANLPCVLHALLARQFGVRTGRMGPVSHRDIDRQTQSDLLPHD